MRQYIHTLSLFAGVVALLLGASLLAVAEDDPSADCGVCHEELATAFGTTLHGLPGLNKPSCVTCHGDGAKHMEEGGDPEYITKPSGLDGATVCQTCHTSTLHRGFSGATQAHPAAGVSCFTCHEVHPTDMAERALLREKPDLLCVSCHPAQRAQLLRPYGHRLEHGGVECVSCHDPHAGNGARSLVTDRGGEGPCVTCHAEKRGPFVFGHVGNIAGDCSSCHEPHGSSNPMALKRAAVHQLCLECHSPLGSGSLGSQPPSLHDLRSPRYRNCTVCHVAIHGSNSSPGLMK